MEANTPSLETIADLQSICGELAALLGLSAPPPGLSRDDLLRLLRDLREKVKEKGIQENHGLLHRLHRQALQPVVKKKGKRLNRPGAVASFFSLGLDDHKDPLPSLSRATGSAKRYERQHEGDSKMAVALQGVFRQIRDDFRQQEHTPTSSSPSHSPSAPAPSAPAALAAPQVRDEEPKL